VGGECRICRRDDEYVQGFSISDHVNERDHFEILGIDEGIILQVTFRREYERMNWFKLAHVTVQ
jgi:hypothetical protein